MDPANTFHAITRDDFDKVLKQYPNTVPQKLTELDEKRYEAIPASLQKQNVLHLTKNQVATLVDWKLSHGKFRPTLRALVQKNDEKDVTTITGAAFKTYAASGRKAADVKAAVEQLAKLKGIGPATASLLLSVYDPDAAPFFSDELFRWCMYEDGKGNGWDRDIKYNFKEYMELYAKVQDLRKRLVEGTEKTLAAVDIEKVAYVLGKGPAGGQANGNATPIAVGASKKRALEPEINEATTASKAGKKNTRRGSEKNVVGKDDVQTAISTPAPATRRSGRKTR